MANGKEIRDHIKSVEQTLKITNAMYLISSANLRKAKVQLSDTLPYFTKIYHTIADIIYRAPEEIQHIYFDRRPHIPKEERKIGYIVITGDKGLAGAYNHNVLQLTEQRMKRSIHPRLFVLGHVGRTYFEERGIPMEEPFPFRAGKPTVNNARTISDEMIKQFRKGDLDEVHLIYTEMVNPLKLRVRELRLLPLVPNDFKGEMPARRARRMVEYVPSVKDVLDNIIPGYVKGMIFGGMVESFCSEQNARMTAMQTANDNAKEMLKKLSLSYNQARQTAITQEITEIVGGSGLFTGQT